MSLLDAQFDRAVEIVQGLPKTGPIQTDYEEKLTMYSLYKQGMFTLGFKGVEQYTNGVPSATVGNVKSPRPAMWDMLARAKWDAWAKHKDLNSYEAKWLYIEALLKVLRKYSDKTMARNLVQELESYNGEASHIIMNKSVSSHSLNQTQTSDRQHQQEFEDSESDEDEDADEDEEEREDQAKELPAH
ncbi:ACBP-domain-containing protein [Lentinula edodes]|uniref:ACBP-domain-containing protein n=1 Tax=Lentinula edodes TaxID=5353 RepID=A0A1Q3DWS1_LENED|nr:ACBP-domain-containing protein [Lentinula edodes]